MSVEAIDRVKQQPAELETDSRPLYKEELARALDIICRDSRVHPERYLQETVVPHGGE
jgi:hypothetical protein